MSDIDFSNTQVAFERKSDQDLSDMSDLFRLMGHKTLVRIGGLFTIAALNFKLPIKGLIRNTLFKQFCGGETLADCQDVINTLNTYSVASALDYGAEGKGGKDAFDLTGKKLLAALQYAADHKSVPVVTCKLTGLADSTLLERISQGQSLTSHEKQEENDYIERLDKLCRKAQELDVGVFIDAEESWIQEAIDQATDLMMSRYNKEKVIVHNTFQLYRHDRLEFLKKSHTLSQQQGYLLGAKLVRGAYMEKERARAQERGCPSPIHKSKEACDKDYNDAIAYCHENHKDISYWVATHNENSTRHQVNLMKSMAHDHPHINFCQLYGMSDNLTFNLSKAGFNVAKYVPYGPIRDVIPYLIRRANENSSVGDDVGRELSLIMKERQRRRDLN